MKGYGFWVLLGLVVLTWIYVWALVDYPPSLAQIGLGVNLWVLRLSAGVILIGSVILSLEKLGKISSLLILISPLTWGLIMMRPVEAILMALFLVLIVKQKGWLILGLLMILTLSNWGKTNIYSSLNMKSASEIAIRRITDEDSLSQKVELPLILRRLANNKLTMMGVSAWKEVVLQLDLESIFFQEMNPLLRKTLPIFFWPAIILLPFGLYKLGKRTLLILFFGWVYFLITPGDYFIRYSWLLVGLAIMLGLNKKIKWLVVVLIAYGFVSYVYDFGKRPDFWLDNRPLVYKNIYSRMGSRIDSKVYITDLIGDSKKYCRYYLGNRCNNFIFGIDNKRELKKSDWQIGFMGEFVGPEFNNAFNDESKVKLEKIGWKIINIFRVRDSVAYRYGDEIIFAQYE